MVQGVFSVPLNLVQQCLCIFGLVHFGRGFGYDFRLVLGLFSARFLDSGGLIFLSRGLFHGFSRGNWMLIRALDLLLSCLGLTFRLLGTWLLLAPFCVRAFFRGSAGDLLYWVAGWCRCIRRLGSGFLLVGWD